MSHAGFRISTRIFKAQVIQKNTYAKLRLFSMATPLSRTTPRRFAPLKDSAFESDAPKLKGIVFDVDGTLCEPQTYMFAQMRSAVSIPKGSDILDHIYALPVEEQDAALEKIRSVERSAMESQVAQPGLMELMTYLDTKKVPKGICTRNFDAPVAHLLDKFLQGQIFGPIVTRDFRPPKPDPAGILHIARTWGLEAGAESLIMVGDSVDDMTAGYRAGAATVLLVNDVNAHLATHEHTDLCIRRLDELIEVLENGFEGRIAGDDEMSDTKGRAEHVLKENIREG